MSQAGLVSSKRDCDWRPAARRGIRGIVMDCDRPMRRPGAADSRGIRSQGPAALLLALCGLLLAPLSSAHAGSQDDAAFREQYLRASKLYGAKDYAAAIPALQAAYAIQPAPQLLYNIGQAFRRLRQWASARVYFEMYSALARDLNLKDRQALQGTLEEVRGLELAERKPEVEVIEKTRTLVIREEKPLPRWLRPLGITAGALGLGMATTGAVFLGLDGLCTQPAEPPATQCTTVYNSQTPGIALTAAGAGMLALGLVTFGLSFRKPSRTQKPVEKEGSLELQILLPGTPIADEPPPSGWLPDGSPVEPPPSGWDVGGKPRKG